MSFSPALGILMLFLVYVKYVLLIQDYMGFEEFFDNNRKDYRNKKGIVTRMTKYFTAIKI